MTEEKQQSVDKKWSLRYKLLIFGMSAVVYTVGTLYIITGLRVIYGW